jgi:hypothetical protein
VPDELGATVLTSALLDPKWGWGPLNMGDKRVDGVMVLTLHHPQLGAIVSIISEATARQMASGLLEHVGGTALLGALPTARGH